jgi:hypothetical protein
VSFQAESASLGGHAPMAARLDYRFRSGNTIRVYGQSASSPRTLSSEQTSALGTVGTPTLNMDALSLGTPGLFGVRGSHRIPVGSGSAAVGVHGAVETQPRPGGTDPAYWRGTTAKFGGSLTASPGLTLLTTEIEVSKSFADSLDGRNLFPGGGALTLTATGAGPILERSVTYWHVLGFYFRPLNSPFPDQPNRLIPVGALMGANASLVFPVGKLLVWPSLELMRESSRTSTTAGAITRRITGAGWTTNLGTTVGMTVNRRLTLTPGAGYVFGAVGATATNTRTSFPPLTVSDSFTDRIRGWWGSLELSSRF